MINPARLNKFSLEFKPPQVEEVHNSRDNAKLFDADEYSRGSINSRKDPNVSASGDPVINPARLARFEKVPEPKPSDAEEI